MRTLPLFVALSLCALTGCELTDRFFEMMENGTLVCTDIQADADICWAEADDEEAAAECEALEGRAGQCTWQPLATDTSTEDGDEVAVDDDTDSSDDDGDDRDEDRDDDGDDDDDACEALAAYADACWAAAVDADDEARCADLDAEVSACRDAE